MLRVDGPGPDMEVKVKAWREIQETRKRRKKRKRRQ